jgi:hypothetical protein
MFGVVICDSLVSFPEMLVNECEHYIYVARILAARLISNLVAKKDGAYILLGRGS